MSTDVINHAALKRYLGEVMDLGDIVLAAIAGALLTKIDQPPQLSPARNGQKVLYAKLSGVEFIFSRRGDSIAVHSTEYGGAAIRGLWSKDMPISEIGRLLEPA
jgi:hypothetical protein